MGALLCSSLALELGTRDGVVDELGDVRAHLSRRAVQPAIAVNEDGPPE